ncbi:MAG: nuclear transport factor 2 family protein [Bryobacteraceae bacterium]
MKKLFATRTILLLLPLAAGPIVPAYAQSQQAKAAPDELFRTIALLDGALFDAYNRCDVEKFASFLADDLEFYHDQTGLSRGRQSSVDALKKNICGKVHRDLVLGTLEVYPLRGFGAVEIGVHRFCDPKIGKCGEGSGEAKFVHLWQNKDRAWKLTRIISYDHCSRCVPGAPPK